ncbi:MAG: pilus assembly protein N-terminal domain-containing protein, partial [Syntrophales bacterium]
MRKRKRNEHIGAVRIMFLVMVFVISPSLAVNSWAASESAAPEKITLSVGKSEIVDVAERVKSVSMDSKGIADYTLLSPRKILITGKAIGATRIVLRKEDQTVLRIMDVEVGSGLNELKVKIHELFPDEKDVKVTAVHDTITLSGTVSSSTNLSQILALAQGYAPRDRDGKPKVMNLLEVGGVHQVMLEVRVSEMSRSLMKRLGFNWNYISSSGSNFGVSLLNNLTSGGWPGHPLTVTDPINMIFRFTGDGASWTFFIDALKDQGLTKVLAEPTLITLSGRPASFLAG